MARIGSQIFPRAATSARSRPSTNSYTASNRAACDQAGTRIRAGDKVVVFHVPDPFALDLTRTPNPHVSFGDAPHVCLGAHFARLQLSVVYEEVCRALPPGCFQLAASPGRLVSNFINGVKSLPVRIVA
ncbi:MULTISPECIES: cytochrome P450 family protein [unclassified Streptomyces]|uniref:hypothetical protein n=1 Tax=Streptomyces sp. NPDC127532 TaxID=3345399 RepID=UPI00362AA34C